MMRKKKETFSLTYQDIEKKISESGLTPDELEAMMIGMYMGYEEVFPGALDRMIAKMHEVRKRFEEKTS